MKNIENNQNQPQVKINIQGQYVKDLSFQSPSAPKIFLELKEQPKIDLNLNINVKDTQQDQYEVTLKIKAEALKNTEVVFSIEMEYAGLFEIKDLADEEQKKQILLIYCPSLIFPFARRIIADVTRDAGFQPLMINPVDFAALYLQQKDKNNQTSPDPVILH